MTKETLEDYYELYVEHQRELSEIPLNLFYKREEKRTELKNISQAAVLKFGIRSSVFFAGLERFCAQRKVFKH